MSNDAQNIPRNLLCRFHKVPAPVASSDPSTTWHKYFTGGGTNFSEAFHYPCGKHKATRIRQQERPLLPPLPSPTKKKLCWETGVAQDQVFAPSLQVHAKDLTRLLNPVWANVRNASKIF